MKALMAIIPLIFSTSIMAAEGWHYCPEASSYHFNSNNGFIEGPGEWRVYMGATKASIYQFKRAEALMDGEMTGCFYDMTIGGVAMEFMTHSNYYFVANVEKPMWHDGPYGKVCLSDSPAACAFREEK